VRAGFEDATTCFLEAVRAVPDERWDEAGALGEWSTRQLVGHTLRAFTTIEVYLAASPKTDRVFADALEYYAAVLSDIPVHAGVADRGRIAGAELTDPIGQVEAAATHISALVSATSDDEAVNTFAGQITFVEYLATRTVELGLHTLDLQAATGQPPSVGAATSAVVLGVLTQLADPVTLLLALTGRRALPPDFNVLR